MKKNNVGKICTCDHFCDFWTLPVDPPHEIHLKCDLKTSYIPGADPGGSAPGERPH